MLNLNFESRMDVPGPTYSNTGYLISNFYAEFISFYFLMLRALYRMICKNAKSFFGKNSLNVSNVKLFSKIFFQHFWFFYAFLVRMTACT